VLRQLVMVRPSTVAAALILRHATALLPLMMVGLFFQSRWPRVVSFPSKPPYRETALLRMIGEARLWLPSRTQISSPAAAAETASGMVLKAWFQRAPAPDAGLSPSTYHTALTVVWQVAVLLELSWSVVVEETETVLLKTPLLEGAVTTIVTFTTFVTSMEPMAQVTRPLVWLQLPWEDVADTNDEPAASVSPRVTPLAWYGPLFFILTA